MRAFLNSVWWSWPRNGSPGWPDALYHYFNLLEGIAWLAFAGLVLARWLRRRKSSLELYYAAAFLFFGLSDFREAWELSTWLILFKGVNLAALVWLRGRVIRKYYPESRTF